MSHNLLKACVLFAIVSVFSGCGTDSAPVSGTVTYDGKPLAGVRVVFTPVSNSTEAMPYSTAVTDDAGAFSLETRDGTPGAVAGLHRVGFDWSDIRSYTLKDLTTKLREADNAEEETRIQAQITEVEQKLASRPLLKAGLQTDFTVPESGDTGISFGLTDY